MSQEVDLGTMLRELVSDDESQDLQSLLDKYRKRRKRRMLVAGRNIAAISLVGALVWNVAPRFFSGDIDRSDHVRPATSAVERLDVPGGAETVATLGARTWVVSHDKRLLALDSDTGSLSALARLPRFGQLFPTKRHLWMGDELRFPVYRIDPSTGDVTGVVRKRPKSVAAGDDALWLLSGAQLVRVDPDTLKRSDGVTIVHDIVDFDSRASEHDLTAGFGAAWFGDGNSGDLVRVDAKDLSVTRIPIGPPGERSTPDSFRVRTYVTSVTTGGGLVWACCSEKGEVVGIEPANNAIVVRGDLFDNADVGTLRMTYNDGALWVSKAGYVVDYMESDYLYRVDGSSGRVSGPYDSGAEINTMAPIDAGLLITALSPDGRRDSGDLLRIPFNRLNEMKPKTDVFIPAPWGPVFFFGAIALLIFGLQRFGKPRSAR